MSNNVIKGCKFHHVALQTSDFDKSFKFYTEGLGFEVYRQWVGGTGKRIALINIGNDQYFEIFSDGDARTESHKDSGSYIHLALEVEDSKAAYDRALQYGAKEMDKAPAQYTLPSEPPINAVISFVKGPDGEELEFFQVL